MDIKTCANANAFVEEIKFLIKADSNEWQGKTITRGDQKIDPTNVRQFLENNKHLIDQHTSASSAIRAFLPTLAARISKEFADEKVTQLALEMQKNSAGIRLPRDLERMIIQKAPDEDQDVRDYYAATAQVSKAWGAMSQKAKAQWINENEVPIGVNFGLKNKDDFMRFVKQCGPHLEYLYLDGNSSNAQIYYNLTAEDFKEIARSCPNLRKIGFNNCTINDEIIDAICQKSDAGQHIFSKLNRLEIDYCSNITRIPDGMPSTLETLKVNYCFQLNQISEHLPDSILELVLRQYDSDEENAVIPEIRLPDHLPPNLRKLKVANFSLEQLPAFSPKLESFSVYNTIGLTELPDRWPPNLKKLFIGGSPLIQQPVVNLPAGLESLEFYDMPAMPSVPMTLPPNIKKFTVDACPMVDELPRTVPGGLKHFHVEFCPLIPRMPEKLPENLECLRVQQTGIPLDEIQAKMPKQLKDLTLGYPEMTEIPFPLPETLKYLEVIDCSKLEKLQESLPKNLEEIYVINCPALKKIPVLPKTMKTIDLTGCDQFKVHDFSNYEKLESVTLPAGATHIFLKNSPSAYLVNIPTSMKTLALAGNQMAEFPSTLQNAQYLDLSRCAKLRSLPDLSNNTTITKLNLDGCQQLKKIEKLPQNLVTINVSNAANCKVLDLSGKVHLYAIEGSFPEGLEVLNLSGCTYFNYKPAELPKSLKKLDVTGIEYLEPWDKDYFRFLKSQNPSLEIVGIDLS